MDTISSRYVSLAHDIERFSPGFIDGYYGPDEWKGTGERTLDEMATEVHALSEEVAALGDASRRTFLEGQVRAMSVMIRLLQGEAISYADEVKGLYDVEAVRVPEAEFVASANALNDLLPGEGTIAEREQAFRRQFEVHPDKLTGLLDIIKQELRSRTVRLFSLPEGEAFDTEIVKNEPWSAYNWYLGKYQSRVDINTDLPTYLVGLPDLMAHEAYPGHHTEHAIKEQRLLNQEGRGEHSILLINAPECVVSEGIATRARRIVMSDDELTDWLEQDLAPYAGLQGAPIRQMLAIFRARRGMRNVTNNAAILLHAEGASEADVIEYLRTYRLATEQEAQKSLRFISHPNFRSYGFTYTVGGDMLDELFKKGDQTEWFARLLSEPLTPGQLREWIAA